MRNSLAFSFLSIIALAGAVAPAVAHHSFAMFDSSKKTKISGKVSQFQWTNPHIFLEVAVPDGKGGSTNWSIEGGAPNVMAMHGWKRTSFKPGDTVEVELRPLRSGAPGGAFITVRTADGTILKGML